MKITFDLLWTKRTGKEKNKHDNKVQGELLQRQEGTEQSEQMLRKMVADQTQLPQVLQNIILEEKGYLSGGNLIEHEQTFYQSSSWLNSCCALWCCIPMLLNEKLVDSDPDSPATCRDEMVSIFPGLVALACCPPATICGAAGAVADEISDCSTNPHELVSSRVRPY